MAVVDTSFLIALHRTSDRFSAAAREHPRLYAGGIVLPEIWTEFLTVISRFYSGAEVRQVVASALEGPFRVAPLLSAAQSGDLAAQLRSANEKLAQKEIKPLSFFGFLVCTVARQRRDEILTFDDGMIAAVKAKMFPGARIA